MVAVGLVTLMALVTGCGTSTRGSGSPPVSANGTAARVPLPAGRSPSAISKMVCSPEAQREIAVALGVKPVTVSTPTWVDHVYSCRYEYTNGMVTLSVKELSSWPETFAYYRSLGTQPGNTGALPNLGQGAFSQRNGSVVVRKDWKVLTVDITGLPSQFGVPPTSASDIAVTVADVILGCWAGD
jgi:hypothetical protein